MTGRRETGGRAGAVAAMAFVMVLAAALVYIAANPAMAAGAGGIEVTPLTDSGSTATAFHVRVAPRRPGTVHFVVRNVGVVPAEARVYAAAVAQTGTTYAVGGPGSAPWIRLDSTTVRLAPGEQRRFSAEVSTDGAPLSSVSGAVVEEPVDGATVQRRVATLVYLEGPRRSPITRPTVLLGIATFLLTLAVAMAALRWRRRRS